MVNFPFQDFVKRRVTISGRQIYGCCPLPEHKDANPSFSGNGDTGLSSCHGCGWKGNWEQLLERLGLGEERPRGGNASGRPVQSAFHYQDLDGENAVRVIRSEIPGAPKSKRIHMESLQDGKWVSSKGKAKLAPYRYHPHWAKREGMVFIVEGEKKSHAIEDLAAIATSNIGGSKAPWPKELAKFFKGREVVILPDNDDAGLEHAKKIYQALKGAASDIAILELPGLGPAEDIVEWLERGGTRAELERLAREALDAEAVRKSEGLLRLSDVRPKPIDWLWPGLIPKGAVTLITGSPGVGKSTISLDIAARVSRGDRMPFDDVTRPPATALVFACEDAPEYVQQPRLVAMNADLTRVLCYPTPINLKDDADIIEACVKAYRPDVVIIDPITVYLGGKVDMNRANEVREATGGLAVLAARYKTAVIMVRHTRKSSNSGPDKTEAIHKGQGSIDFVGIVRSELLAEKDSECAEGTCLLHHSKSNWGRLLPSIRFRPEENKIEWVEVTEKLADDGPKRSVGSPLIDEAKEFLMMTLKEGPRSAVELHDLAKTAGIKEKTLINAKRALKIKSQELHNPKRWQWVLPPDTSGLY